MYDFQQEYQPKYPVAKQQISYLSKFIVFSGKKCTCNLTHSHTMTPFHTPGKKPFENIVEKGKIARYKQFLLFPRSSQKTCTEDM